MDRLNLVVLQTISANLDIGENIKLAQTCRELRRKCLRLELFQTLYQLRRPMSNPINIHQFFPYYLRRQGPLQVKSELLSYLSGMIIMYTLAANNLYLAFCPILYLFYRYRQNVKKCKFSGTFLLTILMCHLLFIPTITLNFRSIAPMLRYAIWSLSYIITVILRHGTFDFDAQEIFIGGILAQCVISILSLSSNYTILIFVLICQLICSIYCILDVIYLLMTVNQQQTYSLVTLVQNSLQLKIGSNVMKYALAHFNSNLNDYSKIELLICLVKFDNLPGFKILYQPDTIFSVGYGFYQINFMARDLVLFLVSSYSAPTIEKYYYQN